MHAERDFAAENMKSDVITKMVVTAPFKTENLFGSRLIVILAHLKDELLV